MTAFFFPTLLFRSSSSHVMIEMIKCSLFSAVQMERVSCRLNRNLFSFFTFSTTLHNLQREREKKKKSIYNQYKC